MKSIHLIGLALSLSACTTKPHPVRAVPPMEAYGMSRNQFAVILDARAKPSAETPELAVQIPAAGVPTQTEKLPKGKEVLVMADDGAQATEIAERLAAKGYKAGTIGTIDDWKAAGLPLQGAPAPFK